MGNRAYRGGVGFAYNSRFAGEREGAAEEGSASRRERR
jgi:hypothetical protein